MDRARNSEGGMTIELDDEELELVCDSLTTEWLDINDKFTLMKDAAAVNWRMERVSSLRNRLREFLDAGTARAE